MGCHGHCLVAIAFLVLFHQDHYSLASATACPQQCMCEEVVCPREFHDFCQTDNERWMDVHCDALLENTISSLPPQTRFLTVSEEILPGYLFHRLLRDFQSLVVLSVKLDTDVVLENPNDLVSNLVKLDLSNGHLQKLPNLLTHSFEKLQMLNMSGNSLPENLVVNLTLPNLKVLDLSRNRISTLSLRGVLTNLNTLYLQGNILKKFPNFGKLPNLEVLNLTKNLINFNLQGNEESDSQCRTALPASLKKLILRDNLVRNIPEQGCGLLAGLPTLEELDLGYNLLRSVSDEHFPHSIMSSLRSLKLDGNNIDFLNPDVFSNFKGLRFLSLSNNRIRSIPVELFETLYHRSYSFNATEPIIQLEGNPISCDCKKRALLQFFHNENMTAEPKTDITCQYPALLSGRKLIELEDADLQCIDITLQESLNATCKEYHECNLRCKFGGLPHPQVHWVSPEGEILSADSLAKHSTLRSTYSLSEDGHQLSITSLRMHLTGIYKCIANNSLGSVESIAQVGLLPDPVGSIIAIAVSAVSFAIAIAVNCMNMCKCYCENLDISKQDKEKEEEEAEEDFKMESPLKSKQKGLHESAASLNANKYYRKYDFACQHIFLDAVIRGAHTVKQTLYDARNSEFSNNVWEYASNLRGRLHIELPSSVQFPRVSMPSISLPSISMPTISMPSMPNLQSINTNIEKLGTSVMSRSHNLASSVGSVFTLRWLRYGTGENDSDSDVESPTVSQVQAHVHERRVDEEESSAESSPTMYARSFSRKFIPKARWSRKPTSTQCETSRDSYVVPTRTKSVRFGNVETFRIARSSSCSEIPLAVSNLTNEEDKEDSVEPSDEVTVDMPKLFQFETSV